MQLDEITPHIQYTTKANRLAYVRKNYPKWDSHKFSFSYKEITIYNKDNRLWNVSNNSLVRYNHIEMNELFNAVLGVNHRRYKEFFQNFEKIRRDQYYNSISDNTVGVYATVVGDDFWSDFQHQLFYRDMRNDQNNQVYIGLDKKYISKKLRREPTPFEMVLQRIYRNIFIHLAHDAKKNWVRVRISW